MKPVLVFLLRVLAVVGVVGIGATLIAVAIGKHLF